MKDQFDLEQQILDCWGICEDLDTLFEGICNTNMTQDQISNVVLGMAELYRLKFERCFNTFEDLIHEFYNSKKAD